MSKLQEEKHAFPVVIMSDALEAFLEPVLAKIKLKCAWAIWLDESTRNEISNLIDTQVQTIQTVLPSIFYSYLETQSGFIHCTFYLGEFSFLYIPSSTDLNLFAGHPSLYKSYF